MVAFAAVGAVVAASISTLAGIGVSVAAPVLFAVVLVCMQARVFGSHFGLAGVLAAVVAVVAVDYPNPPGNALKLASIFLIGCLWAMALCLVLWRVHPHRPARRAIAAVYRDLGYMIADLEAVCRGEAHANDHRHAEHRRALRATIERARSTIGHIAAGHRNGAARRGLTAWIDGGDRLFAGLIALEYEVEERPDQNDFPVMADLLAPLPALINELAHQAQSKNPDWSLIEDGVRQLRSFAGKTEGLYGRVATYWAEALQDVMAGWQNRTAWDDEKGAAAKFRLQQPAATARHALRVAVAVIIAYGLSVVLRLPYSYWATMAVVVVMQPSATTTWPRMLERVLGSIFGGVLAAALWLLAPSPAVLALVVFPLAAGCIAFRSVNYTLHVLFLTPLFVLVADLIDPGHGTGIAMSRALNNVLGSVLGFVACLAFWPEQEKQPFAAKLAEAVEANFAYAALAADPLAETEALEAARRKAGIATSAAEIIRERMVLEGRRGQGRLNEAAGLLSALRRLAGASTAAWLSQDPSRGGAPRYRALQQDLVFMVRDPSAPVPRSLWDGFRTGSQLEKATLATIRASFAYALARARMVEAKAA
nr:FUSC family protein [Rhizomicrobium palustre]